MTESSLLTAAISMQEAAFRRYIASKPAAAFAEEAARIIIDADQDYLILRYLKKESVLYLAFCFNWGDKAEDIMSRPYFSSLLGVSAFLSGEEGGRIIISPGAANFLDDGVEAAFTVTAAGSERDDNVPLEEMKRFDRLLTKYFFATKPGERSYQDAIKSPSIFDSKLRKSVDTLLEAHRVKVAKERLPHASPLHPVRLCARYHYNGHFVLYSKGFAPLPDIDPQSFYQTAWGACDASHAIIGGLAVATNPKKFKMHHRGEGKGMTFYADESHVYTSDVEPIDGADPSTFKIAANCFARDRAHWYYSDGTVLADVGDNAKIDTTLYFRRYCLLMGSRTIYMGKRRLPLDAPTCRLRRVEKFPSGPFTGLALAWFTDKDGDLIMASRSDDEAEPQILRTEDPEKLWDELQKTAKDKRPRSIFAEAAAAIKAATPETMEGEAERRVFVTFFEDWLATYFDRYRAEYPYDSFFWSGVNNYFYCCWHLGEHEKIVTLYRRVEEDAWWYPGLFHHTACAFCALGDLDQAVIEVRRALMYCYDKVDSLLADPDIEPLFGREDFQRLKAFREANPGLGRRFLPLELLQIFASKRAASKDFAPPRGFGTRYLFPSAALISSAYADNPEGAERYHAALAAFLDDNAARQWRDQRFLDEPYADSGDIAGLHPATHLIGAISLYAEGFSWIDIANDDRKERQEFRKAAEALRRMQERLDAVPEYTDDPFWREVATSTCGAAMLRMAAAAVTEVE